MDQQNQEYIRNELKFLLTKCDEIFEIKNANNTCLIIRFAIRYVKLIENIQKVGAKNLLINEVVWVQVQKRAKEITEKNLVYIQHEFRKYYEISKKVELEFRKSDENTEKNLTLIENYRRLSRGLTEFAECHSKVFTGQMGFYLHLKKIHPDIWRNEITKAFIIGVKTSCGTFIDNTDAERQRDFDYNSSSSVELIDVITQSSLRIEPITEMTMVKNLPPKKRWVATHLHTIEEDERLKKINDI